nr:AMP-binding protein [Mycobacterium sp. E342]
MTFRTDSTEVPTRSLGHLLPGRDYCLADSEGLVLPVGQAGELCVRGPLTCRDTCRRVGSWTLTPAVPDGRRTGDIYVSDDSGILRIRGRSREVVIHGGANIYPAEVEQQLSPHPAVRGVAVFGVPDRRLGQQVVAAVLPAVGADSQACRPRSFAEDTLSPSKRPAKWLVLEEFPRTASGEVRKHLLAAEAARVDGDGQW